jgi:hypothetical protein
MRHHSYVLKCGPRTGNCQNCSSTEIVVKRIAPDGKTYEGYCPSCGIDSFVLWSTTIRLSSCLAEARPRATLHANW